MKTKKNGKTLRVAGLLLALVLVTSCFVGGTFAKYVTSDKSTDSARVAKFGVTVTANGTVFAEEYKDPTDTTVTVKSVGAMTVGGKDYKNLVAPGTKGDLAKAVLSGTPEVSVRVDYTAEVSLGDNWVYKSAPDAAGQFYCPLTIKINNTAIDGVTYSNKQALESAIAETINGYSKTYAPNTNLGNQGDDALKISWTWAFETGEGADAIKANDVKDTYLGDQAVAGNPGTITVGLTTTVTQID